MNLIIYYGNSKDILNIVEKYKKDYNASIYEIETINPVGFFTKLKNEMVSIKRCPLNIGEFDNIILISELWYDKVPSPVIRFLEQMTGRIKNIMYVLYNKNKDDKPKEFDKMDKILNLRRLKSFFVTLDKKEIRVRVYQ
ncbi:MAG: hypothetical protein IKN63_03440 [Bacilli bacterium]|nr:hypothetical protein [Bacilli bacterium]